jgi:ABC-type polysaccharide/polyol phosphate transport system ATPase subunit
MPSASIEMTDVSLQYPAYSVRARSLRAAAINLAIGGRLMKARQSDRVVISALDKISVSLGPGDRLALIGVNGSGKSSLLKVMAGIYQPTSGTCRVTGETSSMLDIGLGLDMEATGVENIKIMACIRGHVPWKLGRLVDDIINFSELGAYALMPVKMYSSGMIARLLFATATAFSHEILLLEEWLSAGDASFLAKATGRMNGIAEKSQIIVTATHNFDLARAVCNKVMVLDHGAVVFLDTAEEFFRRYDRDVAALAEATQRENSQHAAGDPAS